MGCYAKALGGCSGGISREHYISDAILKLHAKDNSQGELINIRGMGGIFPEGKILPISKFGTKILCSRHNSELSKYDDTMLAFLLAFRKTDSVSCFVGGDLERWFLKLMLGYYFGIGARKMVFSDPDKWVTHLFRKSKLPDGSGLYIDDGDPTMTVPHPICLQELKFQFLTAGSELKAVKAVIQNFPFLFCLESPPESTFPRLTPHFSKILVPVNRNVIEIDWS